jgi:hypothetical protein
VIVHWESLHQKNWLAAPILPTLPPLSKLGYNRNMNTNQTHGRGWHGLWIVLAFVVGIMVGFAAAVVLNMILTATISYAQ